MPLMCVGCIASKRQCMLGDKDSNIDNPTQIGGLYIKGP